MKEYEKIYSILKNLNIPFEVVEHPPAITTEEADSYIEGIEGVRTKTLFLTNNKKRNFYLLIMDGKDRLDMENFSNKVEEKRVKLASDELLFNKLGTSPGMVSIFGIVNNLEKDIKIYFDNRIIAEKRMSFHPNDNTKTIFLKTEDVLKFLKSEGFDYFSI